MKPFKASEVITTILVCLWWIIPLLALVGLGLTQAAGAYAIGGLFLVGIYFMKASEVITTILVYLWWIILVLALVGLGLTQAAGAYAIGGLFLIGIYFMSCMEDDDDV